jgi:hypothetical protein
MNGKMEGSGPGSIESSQMNRICLEELRKTVKITHDNWPQDHDLKPKLPVYAEELSTRTRLSTLTLRAKYH